MMTIGKNVRERREKAGLTRVELGRLANVSMDYLAKLEADAVPNPGLETIKRIAKALNCKLQDLDSKVA